MQHTRVNQNNLLSDLHGLENLQYLMDLNVFGNASLLSLFAPHPLQELTRSLTVGWNASLPACAVWALEAETGRTCGAEYAMPCSGNTGTAGCGSLPPTFSCVPGARGPGVYDRDLWVSQGSTTWFPFG